jgi:predicted outer membrane protein
MTITRITAWALAASLAAPPAALAKSPTEKAREMRDKAAQKGEVGQHERELGQAQQTHEKGTPSPLDDAQREALGALWARTQLAGQVATLGMSRAKSPEVKNLARWLGEDHRRVTQDLGKLLQERGADPAKLPPGPDHDRIQGEIGALAKASGDDFDRAFVDFVNRNSPSLKDSAGRARDATPGRDADLKWYLDQVERLEIGHRDSARQLASQRQARTPPAPPQRPAGK